MNTIKNILIGGSLIAIIALAGWLTIELVVWVCDVVGKCVGAFVDTAFSPDAMKCYGRILFWTAVVFVAWAIGKAIRKLKQ